MDNSYVGAKTKRPGYDTFLGTANGSAVIDLFSWTKADGTSTYVYRNSGGILSYWDAGVGTATTWTTCGGGTLTAGNHLGHTVLAETLIADQAGGTCISSTSGTSFGTVALAPPGEHLATYQNRVFIGGTASTLFWSASGSGTDWATSGTSDSSSQTIPGAGKINKVFISSDRVVTSKTSGLMYRWDGYTLSKLPTDKGLDSPYSLIETENYFFYINRDGIYGFGGDKPEIVSNAIQPQIYNNAGSGIVGSVFDTAPAGIIHYDGLFSVGDVTDTVSQETITNDIIKYDYQLNQFTDYSFAHKPTAWTTYIDKNGVTQLIFGDDTGQCYKVSGTATSDSGTPIETVMEGVLSFESPETNKIYHSFYAIASPGCGAKVQICASDTFTASRRNWIDIGEFKDGVAKFDIPSSYVGRLLWWRVYERSDEAPFTIYGFVVDLDILKD
ncbi:hypothetical protein KJ836_02630 [Patescibacteria group bacterium]|nr:hypothetical protein [Patescibacteria group bacterium]